MRLSLLGTYIGRRLRYGVRNDVTNDVRWSRIRTATSAMWRSGGVTNYPSRSKYTISYVHGHDHSTNVPTLLGKTIGQIVDETTEKYPDKEFAVFSESGQRRTFHEFREESNRLAAGLVSLGIKRGDRVGIWGLNTLEWILTQYATARIGAILVNLNPAYRPSDIEYTLQKVGVKAIIASKPFKTQNYYEMLAEVCPELGAASPGELKSKRLPALESVIIMGSEEHPGTFVFDDVLEMGGPEQSDVIDRNHKNLQFDDVINIQFTSGTTGMPKATCLTHFNLVNNMLMAKYLHPTTPDMIRCVPAPMFHVLGTAVSVLAMMSGNKMVFPSAGFNAAACLQAIQDERCTHCTAAPTMIIDMLNHPEFLTFDLSSLMYLFSGGSSVSEKLMKQVTTHIPSLRDCFILYGMTEASGLISAGFPGDPEELRFSTVGRAIPWLEVKLTDPLTGDIVPVNASGELCTRSTLMMSRYWDDEETTKETIDEAGWLHSGDLASMDEDGYFKIIGRIKDVVIRGGENIFPAQIEELLYAHHKIEDVQVVGVRDERLIEELCACVKLKSGQTCTEEEIREFCEGKVPYYMVPRYVQFVTGFPLTTSGKVQKFKLKEEMTELLQLS